MYYIYCFIRFLAEGGLFEWTFGALALAEVQCFNSLICESRVRLLLYPIAWFCRICKFCAELMY
jgi:hypothetical protein